jgi:hypothetical protein
MTREEAVKMVNELVAASSAVTKAVNSGNGVVSRTKGMRERNAAKKLFLALIGNEATAEEASEMVTL